MADANVAPVVTDTVTIDIPTPVETLPQGFHAIMDCDRCEVAKMTDVDNIKSWLDAVATIIATIPSADAWVVTNASGRIVTQIFDDASITIRCFNSAQQIYVDIFSLKEFDPIATEQTLLTFFGTNIKVNKILLPRNASI